jgi:preprotein translocase subunit Sec63
VYVFVIFIHLSHPSSPLMCLSYSRCDFNVLRNLRRAMAAYHPDKTPAGCSMQERVTREETFDVLRNAYESY